MGFALRDYQAKGYAELQKLVKLGKRAILVIAPTGAGKGTFIAYLATKAIEKGNKVDVVIHRLPLLKDIATRTYEISEGRVKPTIKAPGMPKTNHPFKLWSVQTLAKRVYTAPDILVVDEAHRIMADSYQKAVAAAKERNSVIIGFTATPERLDGKMLKEVFEEVVVLATAKELIQKRFLVPDVYRIVDSKINFGKIKITQGKAGKEYNDKEMAKAFDEANIYDVVVEKYCEETNGKQVVIFHSSVANANKQKEAFMRKGIQAGVASADSSEHERERLLKAYADYKVQVIINVGLFTEGIDLPVCDAVFLCFSTLSISKYIQCVGRGSRPIWDKKTGDWLKDENGVYVKDHFKVIDFGENVLKHGKWSMYGMAGFSLEGQKTKRKKEKEEMLKAIECTNCGFIIDNPQYVMEDVTCESCGFIHIYYKEMDDDIINSIPEYEKDIKLREITAQEAFESQLFNMPYKKALTLPDALLRSYDRVHKMGGSFVLTVLKKRYPKAVLDGKKIEKYLSELERDKGIAEFYNAITSVSQKRKSKWQTR